MNCEEIIDYCYNFTAGLMMFILVLVAFLVLNASVFAAAYGVYVDFHSLTLLSGALACFSVGFFAFIAGSYDFLLALSVYRFFTDDEAEDDDEEYYEG